MIKRSRSQKQLLCCTHVHFRVNADLECWIQDAGVQSEMSTGLLEAVVQQVGSACSVYASRLNGSGRYFRSLSVCQFMVVFHHLARPSMSFSILLTLD